MLITMTQRGEMTVAGTNNAASSDSTVPRDLTLDTGSWHLDAANVTEQACVLGVE